MREWGQALHDLTGAQIGVALEKCRNELHFLPTIAEFRKASGWTAPIEYFHAEPRQPIEPEKAGRISKMLKESLGHIGRRALPHGSAEYDEALKAARAAGRSMYDVDMEFLGRSGWTEADEESWRRSAGKLGLAIADMYPRGHYPETTHGA